jgi:hypothetical protein
VNEQRGDLLVVDPPAGGLGDRVEWTLRDVVDVALREGLRWFLGAGHDVGHDHEEFSVVFEAQVAGAHQLLRGFLPLLVGAGVIGAPPADAWSTGRDWVQLDGEGAK